ncbi:MAG TPA: hypothetical protein VFR63_07170 [Gaiellaceae bacterium]|nr:hypothetical protein [Gaiellaceae bacterium]
MRNDTTTVAPDEPASALSEERLAELLRELATRRAALREELEQVDDAAARLERELARRGSGG